MDRWKTMIPREVNPERQTSRIFSFIDAIL